MNNNRNKVSYFWVLVVFIISISVAYASTVNAKTVRDLYKEQELAKRQQELDFPVLEHWDAGNGEKAIWVDPMQSLAPLNLPQVVLDTPAYKMNLNAGQPQTLKTDPSRIYRTVAKVKLFSWD